MPDPRVANAVDALLALDETGRRAVSAQLDMRLADTAEHEPLPLHSLGDYLALDLPIPPELVRPLVIVRQGVVCTVARSGKGKTVFNLNRIVAWAAGAPLFPALAPVLEPVQPLKTLIIENEGAAALFQRQVRKMAEHGPFSAEQKKQVHANVTIYGDGGYQDMRLDDPAQHRRIIESIEQVEPDILFIEPLRQLHSKDENNSQEMNNVLMELQRISADYGLAVITAHHERKSGSGDDGDEMSAARGSTVLEGALVAMENLRHITDGDFTELSWSKSRYDAKPADIRMKWNNETNWYEHVAESELEAHIITALGESDGRCLTLHALKDAIGETYQKTRRTANELVSSGRIGRGSQGKETIYRIKMEEEDGIEF